MTQQKKINRRQFLGHLGAVGGATVLAACAPTTTAPAAVEAPAAQTLKTARLAMDASVTSADTMDPAYRTSGTDAVLQAAFYEGLVSRDPSLTPIPELAESWEPNEDGSEWIFKLREGVTFHDGKPFVAADVVYTYQRLIDPDVGSPGASNFSALTPDGIVAVDDHTVRIRLTQPDVDFPNTTVFSQSLIVPEGATNDDLAATPMGTGPFKLEGFIPGETTTIASKYEGYWRPGEPKVDVLEILSIPEAEARVAALQSGQVDIIMRTPPTKLDALESDPGIALIENPIGTSIVAYCHADTPPFDDNNVRLAIKYATNRQQMLDLVVQGRGTLMNDTPIPSIIEGGLPGPPREHNVEKAKELLSMAGYPDGIDLTFEFAEFGAFENPWATVWQQQLAEAGIRIELDSRPTDTYWGEVWLQDGHPFAMSGWNVRPTQAGLALWYKSDADWNETRFKSESWDALLAQARATVNKDERIKIFHQLQQQVVDEGSQFVPFMQSFIDATRSNVSGWVPSAGKAVYSTIDVA